MPSGVYKRSIQDLKRIRNLRVGKLPWNKDKPWQTKTKKLISLRKQERDKITKQAYLNWLVSGMIGQCPLMPGRKRLCNGNAYHRVKDIQGNEYPEHRLLVELVIGRKLLRKEVVHHINGQIQDNRPENLCVFGDEKYHSRYHNHWLKQIKSQPDLESLNSFAKNEKLNLIQVVIGQIKLSLIDFKFQ